MVHLGRSQKINLTRRGANGNVRRKISAKKTTAVGSLSTDGDGRERRLFPVVCEGVTCPGLSLSPTLPKSRAGVSFPRENSPSNGWRSCSSRFLPLGSYRERCVRPRCKHDGNSTSRSVQWTPAYSRTSLRWHVSSTRCSGKICPSAVFSVEKYSPITVFSYHFQD